EGNRFAGDVLQLDRDVLEHVAEPGALTLAHAAEKAARLTVGAAVLGKPGERRGQRIYERGAQSPGGPRLQGTEVQLEANDGEARVERGADIDGTVEDAHGCCWW